MGRDPLLGITELARVGKVARWRTRQVYCKALPTPEEVARLLHAAEHDLTAAAVTGIPPRDRFGLVYQAALHLAAIIVRASGYRTRRARDPENLFAALPALFGSEGRILRRSLADRRVTWQRECEGGDSVSGEDASRFSREVEDFHESVLEWLRSKHDDLLGQRPDAPA